MAEVAALNSLLRGASISDHDEALRLANAAIKSAGPKTAQLATAQRAKVVALLNLDRFDDALRFIAGGGGALETACVLEKAYALYKTGELEAAEAALSSSSGGDGRALKHIAAQVAYRAEKFEDAAVLYRELMAAQGEEGQYDEENDLKINLLATQAQLEWQGKGHLVPEKSKQPGREDLEAFETAYNAACGCLARGDFAKANILLKRAKDICEMSDDLSDEEKRVELVPIIIQQTYACTRLGKTDEAIALQRSIVPSEVSDAATKTIAQSNSLALQPHANPYLTQRWIQSLPETKGNDKLFEYQAAVLKRNRYIIELQAQKFSGVKATTAELLKRGQTSKTSAEVVGLGVLNAAAAAKLQTGKDALQRILPLLDARPDDVGLLLTIIQLYIQTENPMPALTLLEAFFKRIETAVTPDHADVRFAPGLVAVAVALYRLQGRHNAIRAELAKAAAHWQKKNNKQDPTAGGNGSLLREAGIELLNSSDPQDLAIAGAAFERICAAKGDDDRAATAGLVASFATSDYAKVEPHLAALTPVDRLTAGIDVAALLDAGVATFPSAAPTQSSKKRALDATGSGQQQQQQEAGPAKKKRRRKLPENYEEGKKMDPERWLPLRDRSSYRPKGKKGKKRAQEATQGGVVREEETLELVGGAGAVKVEKAPAGGAGGKKGKKKAKK